VRGRALLLVLLVGALAVGVSTAVGLTPTAVIHPDRPVTRFARAELVDAAIPFSLTPSRDGTARDHDARRDVIALLAVASAIALAGCSWLTRERRAHALVAHAVTAVRPRAPPLRTPAVHC
jgi:hypothetical protein